MFIIYIDKSWCLLYINIFVFCCCIVLLECLNSKNYFQYLVMSHYILSSDPSIANFTFHFCRINNKCTNNKMRLNMYKPIILTIQLIGRIAGTSDKMPCGILFYFSKFGIQMSSQSTFLFFFSRGFIKQSSTLVLGRFSLLIPFLLLF